MNRLAWKKHLFPSYTISGDNLILLSEHGHYLLQGKVYVQIASHLDGQWSYDEILDKVKYEDVTPFEVQLALSHLQALGCLCNPDVEAATGWKPEEIAYWHSLDLDASTVAQRLNQIRINVRSLGKADATPLRFALESVRVKVVEDDEAWNRLIIVTDDYLHPDLEDFNNAQLLREAVWGMVKLAGTSIWIGPFFTPGMSPCWACLAQRLRLNRQTEYAVEACLSSVVQPPLPFASWSVQMAAELAAIEILHWLVNDVNNDYKNGILTLDLNTNEWRHHHLLRRPQCRACGSPQLDSAYKSLEVRLPLDLSSSSKSITADRRELPDAIFQRLKHHVSPITGLVRELVESSEDGSIHVATSQAFPMHRYDFRVLRDNLYGRSGGKGITVSENRTSALCEALERYSGIWHAEGEQVFTASRAEAGNHAIDLNICLGFSDQQYASRDIWNASNDDPHSWVPKPLGDDIPVEWASVWSLTQNRWRLLPAAYCYFGHPDLKHGFCASDSNGCAAGNTLTEAAAFGLLELIERDAAAIWWFNRLSRPAVDLDQFALPMISDLQRRYKSQGRSLWALDLTTDLEVPVIIAISARAEHPTEDIIFGFGAGFDAETALTRAILEMDQSYYLVATTSSRGETQYRTDNPVSLRWFRTATLTSESYLVPDLNKPMKSPSDYSWPHYSDWKDDIFHCVECLKSSGLETLILDQTRPDVGLAVCRIIVPGLCHFWRRFGARRLYELPVRLGWQATQLAEDEMNPWCIYF